MKKTKKRYRFSFVFVLKCRKDDNMSNPEKIVFVFPSIHHSMEGEDLFTKSGLAPDYIQVPASLGLGCGTGVMVNKGWLSKAADILQENRVPYLAIFGFKPNGGWEKLPRPDFKTTKR